MDEQLGWYTADGGASDSDMFLNNNNKGSLIAYVGDDPYLGTGTYFTNTYHGEGDFFPLDSGYWPIGVTAQFVSNTNGYLYLGMNDDASSRKYADNQGCIISKIFTGNNITNSFGVTNSDMQNGAPTISNIHMLDGNYEIDSNSFSFNISGLSNTTWAVYASSDLINWVFLDIAPLGNDSCTNFINQHVSTPYRFYKVCNGVCSSRTVGFIRLVISPGNNLITDQLEHESGTNSLTNLFSSVLADGTVGMPDGTQLPDCTLIQTYTNGYPHAYIWYEEDGWDDGSGLLTPGIGAWFCNPTTNSFTITFTGFVPEGRLTNSISAGWNLISSIVPQAGPIDSVLGYNAPTPGDQIETYKTPNFTDKIYDDLEQCWLPSTPILQVGEAFWINHPGTATNWVRDFKPLIVQ